MSITVSPYSWLACQTVLHWDLWVCTYCFRVSHLFTSIWSSILHFKGVRVNCKWKQKDCAATKGISTSTYEPKDVEVIKLKNAVLRDACFLIELHLFYFFLNGSEHKRDALVYEQILLAIPGEEGTILALVCPYKRAFMVAARCRATATMCQKTTSNCFFRHDDPFIS